MTICSLPCRSECVLGFPDPLLGSVQLPLISWDCCFACLLGLQNLVLLPLKVGSFVSQLICLQTTTNVDIHAHTNPCDKHCVETLDNSAPTYLALLLGGCLGCLGRFSGLHLDIACLLLRQFGLPLSLIPGLIVLGTALQASTCLACRVDLSNEPSERIHYISRQDSMLAMSQLPDRRGRARHGH